MKVLRLLMTPLFVVVITLCSYSACISVADSPGFAVVELFTSEGCSSCPPADELLGKIQKENAGKPVYILAYHVDYWDRGGWKDKFSNPDYTSRQHNYAKWLGVQQIYTPQAVVNGTTEMVGSEEEKLRKAIKENVDFPAQSVVTLSQTGVSAGQINLHFEIKGNLNASVLTVGVVQHSASDNVDAGENKGRTLSHVQIVRALKIVKAKSKGDISIPIPQDFNIKQGEVIAFVQNSGTGLITGAASVAL